MEKNSKMIAAERRSSKIDFKMRRSEVTDEMFSYQNYRLILSRIYRSSI